MNLLYDECNAYEESSSDAARVQQRKKNMGHQNKERVGASLCFGILEPVG